MLLKKKETKILGRINEAIEKSRNGFMVSRVCAFHVYSKEGEWRTTDTNYTLDRTINNRVMIVVENSLEYRELMSIADKIRFAEMLFLDANNRKHYPKNYYMILSIEKDLYFYESGKHARLILKPLL